MPIVVMDQMRTQHCVFNGTVQQITGNVMTICSVSMKFIYVMVTMIVMMNQMRHLSSVRIGFVQLDNGDVSLSHCAGLRVIVLFIMQKGRVVQGIFTYAIMGFIVYKIISGVMDKPLQMTPILVVQMGQTKELIVNNGIVCQTTGNVLIT